MKTILSILLCTLLLCCQREPDLTQSALQGRWQIQRIEFLGRNTAENDSVKYYNASFVEFKKGKANYRAEVTYRFDNQTLATAAYVINSPNQVFFNEPCCDEALYKNLRLFFRGQYEVELDQENRRVVLEGEMELSPVTSGRTLRPVRVHLLED